MSNQPMTGSEEIQVVSFRVGGHTFAVNVFEVERVLRYQSPTAVPKAPAFLEGMLSRDNDLVPVIDLRKRLEVEAAITDDTRTILLEWEQGRIGIVVDAVLELMTVNVDAVKPPPPIVQGLAAEYVYGVIMAEDRNVIVLATAKLLSSSERLTLDKLTAESNP